MVMKRRKDRKEDKEVNLGYFVPVCYFVLGERGERIKREKKEQKDKKINYEV